MRRQTALGALTTLVALTALVPAPAVAETTSNSARLIELNGSGVYGQVNVLEQNGELRVNVSARGLEPGQVHLQHIHGFVGGPESTCPGSDLDTDGDGLTSFAEGLPAYGPPVIVLGQDRTSADALSYSRTFAETASGAPVASLGNLDQYTVVVHGLTVDGNYVVSLPVACAVLDVSGAR